MRGEEGDVERGLETQVPPAAGLRVLRCGERGERVEGVEKKNNGNK